MRAEVAEETQARREERQKERKKKEEEREGKVVSVALNTLTESMQLGRNEMLTEFVGFYPQVSNFTFLFL